MLGFLVTADGGSGLSYAQTRAKSLKAPTRGVRVPVDSSWMDQVRAVSLLLPDGAAFCHQTALRIYGIDFGDEHPLHVTVPQGSNRGTRVVVAWHRSDVTRQRRRVKGVIVTTPWKTWCDLGGVLELPALVAVTDLLLRRGLLTRSELIVPKACRGAVNLRRAAELGDPRSNSVRESEIRVHMINRGLPPADLNPNVYEDGGWVAVSDFVWWKYHCILEYDGEHHLTLDQKHQDEITRAALRQAGWAVMAIDAKHYKRLSLTLAEIEEMLRSRGWRP